MNRWTTDQSFLGRVFDSYQNMQQIARCLIEASRQMGIDRPRLVEFSRRPTGIQDYFPEADWVRYPTHLDNEPNLSDPVVLPFADKSIDGCLISDVYEHIPASSRPALLKEMLRITNGLVLVACPNGNELVSRLDKMVFDFIWGKYGESFTPLAQHVEFGVEPVEQVVATLKAQGADEVAVMPANYVYRWIQMILIYFDLQHRNPGGHLFEPLNRIYNERLSPFDYREPCYRYLIAIPTNPDIQIDKLNEVVSQIPGVTPSVPESDQMLTQTFREIDSSAADEIRRLNLSIKTLQEQFEGEKSRLVNDHQALLSHQQEVNQQIAQQLENAQTSLLEHQAMNQTVQQQLANAQASLLEHQAIIQSIREQLSSAQAQVNASRLQLRVAQTELDRIFSTLGWKVLSVYGRFKYRYLLRLYRFLGLSHYVKD